MDEAMKTHLRLPALLPLILLCLQADAQVWCPPGAVWHWSGYTDPLNTYTVNTYVGDIPFSGGTMQEITSETHYYTFNPPGYHMYTGPTRYTWVDNGVVYHTDNSNVWFDTLIWFTAVPGDHWQVPQPQDFFCECNYLVTDTGHTQLAGHWLRFVQTVKDGDCWNDIPVRFVERIGSFHMTWEGECALSESPDTLLRCYQDLDMNYSVPGSPGCDFISTVRERTVPSSVLAWPNPGTDRLHIGPNATSITELRMLDATGRTALSGIHPDNGPISVNTSSLSPGIYCIVAITSKGKQTVRWVKQ